MKKADIMKAAEEQAAEEQLVQAAEEQAAEEQPTEEEPTEEQPTEEQPTEGQHQTELMEVDDIRIQEAEDTGNDPEMRVRQARPKKRKSAYVDDKAEVEGSDEEDSDEEESEEGADGEDTMMAGASPLSDVSDWFDLEGDADSARILQEKQAKADERAQFEKMAEAAKRKSHMRSQTQRFMNGPIATDHRQWNYLNQEGSDEREDDDGASNLYNGQVGIGRKLPSATETRHTHHADDVEIDDDDDRIAILVTQEEDDDMDVEDSDNVVGVANRCNLSDMYVPHHVTGHCHSNIYKNNNRQEVKCEEMKVVIQFTSSVSHSAPSDTCGTKVFEIIDVFVVPSRPIELSHMDPSFLELIPDAQFPRMSRCIVEVGWEDIVEQVDPSKRLSRLNRLAPFVRATYKGNNSMSDTEKKMHCQLMERLDLNNNPTRMYIFKQFQRWFDDVMFGKEISFVLSPKFHK